jgi:hypothetical protein
MRLFVAAAKAVESPSRRLEVLPPTTSGHE